MQEVSTETNVTLELKDTRPKWTLADLAGNRQVVADSFKLSTTLLDCGASISEGVDILGMTVKGKAVSGIDANLSDVESLKLYYDTNRDGDFVGEPLLAETTFADANATFVFENALTVYPGVEAHLVLVYELTDVLCPCNRYESSLSALFLSRAEVTFIETGPFQAQMEVPAETVGEFPIVVAARDLTGNLRIGKVTLLVEQNAQLNELIVQPAGLFMKPGMRLNLRVDGRFSDGVTRKLTDSGTLYLSADEGVVTVDEFGSVEYQGPGGTTILVTNGEVEQVVKVRN